MNGTPEPLMMVSFTPSWVAKKPSLIYKIKIKNQKLLKKLVAHSRFSSKSLELCGWHSHCHKPRV